MNKLRLQRTFGFAISGGLLLLGALTLPVVIPASPLIATVAADDDDDEEDKKGKNPGRDRPTPTPTVRPPATAAPTATRQATTAPKPPTPTPEPSPTRTPTPRAEATPTASVAAPQPPTPTLSPTNTREPTPTSPPPPTPRPAAPPSSGESGGGGGGSGGGVSSDQPPKIVFVPQPRPTAAAVIAPLAPGVPPTVAAAPTPEPLRFVLGFATLKAHLGPIMGDPVEPEHGTVENCDTQQLTTTGLAYWLCATDMLGFVAFPDGMQHWALTPLGIAEWSGETAEPPIDATIRSASDLALLPVAVPETDAACLDPGADPLTACAISAGSTTLGYITTAGGMRAYGFEVGPTGATVSVSLLDLPADYDLYLVDDLAQVVGESVHEGVEAEHIGLDLGAGRYYLYVNSDVGRPFVADLPFRLDLSFAQAR